VVLSPDENENAITANAENAVTVIYDIHSRLATVEDWEAKVAGWKCGKRFRAAEVSAPSNQILFRKILLES